MSRRLVSCESYPRCRSAGVVKLVMEIRKVALQGPLGPDQGAHLEYRKTEGSLGTNLARRLIEVLPALLTPVGRHRAGERPYVRGSRRCAPLGTMACTKDINLRAWERLKGPRAPGTGPGGGRAAGGLRASLTQLSTTGVGGPPTSGSSSRCSRPCQPPR